MTLCTDFPREILVNRKDTLIIIRQDCFPFGTLGVIAFRKRTYSMNEEAERETNENEELERGLVPRGTMLPFFGAVLPGNRWVFADGKSNWPNASWVPQDLQGTPVPNMEEGNLIGGAITEDENGDFTLREVGTRYAEGSIDINLVNANITLNTTSTENEKQTTPPTKEQAAHGSFGDFPSENFDNREFAIATSPDQPPFRFRIREPQRHGYKQQHLTIISAQLTTTEAVALEDRKNAPPHYRCRWIIRIR